MTKKSFRSKAIQNSVQTRLSLILILTATSILAVFASFNYITAKSDMIAELSDLSDFWAMLALIELFEIPKESVS